MKVSTEAAGEIAADTRKIIYPEGRVRQLAADLVSERGRVAELEAHLKAAMSLLIDWQATANGNTHERATLAAKVSDWLVKRCADGTWRQLQQAETLDNQTAGETAERENHD